MSKERALRRAAREAERERREAERTRRDASAARRRERLMRWRGRLAWIPGLRTTRWARSTGPLATKRRRRWGLIAVAFLVLQALTWVVTPSWGLRVAVLVVSLFAIPVMAVLASSS